MTAIFLSDVHLVDGDSVKTRLVIRFLQEVASRFEKIFVLGDLFDVWPGTTDFLLKNYKPVLDTLSSLVRDGHEVHFVEGNHDFRLGNYFTKELGIQVHSDSYEEVWKEKRVLMMHGDLGNPRDFKYRILRTLLRQDVLHLALRAIPSEWIYKVGRKSSQLSRGVQSRRINEKLESTVRQIYRSTAEDFFRRGADVVLMGHTHLPDDVTTTVSGRKCRYINTGDWVKNFSYVEYDGDNFYTKNHPVISN